jgi:hypothetical protein
MRGRPDDCRCPSSGAETASGIRRRQDTWPSNVGDGPAVVRYTGGELANPTQLSRSLTGNALSQSGQRNDAADACGGAGIEVSRDFHPSSEPVGVAGPNHASASMRDLAERSGAHRRPGVPCDDGRVSACIISRPRDPHKRRCRPAHHPQGRDIIHTSSTKICR